MESSLQVHPDEVATVCVQRSGQTQSLNSLVYVDLKNEGAPHLGEFLYALLSFPLNQNQVCFDLPIAAVNVAASYELKIRGTEEILVVEVEEEAAEPVHYCGVIPPSDAQDIGEAPDLYLYSRAFDRFGNIFNSKDLSPFDSFLTGGCRCPEGSGIFELSFEDICANRNYGFADPTLGGARRNTACRVFSDLSVLLNPTGQIAQGTCQGKFLEFFIFL
ncbi:MAG: hypothetical protein DA408_09530 [Bacteroidetes bacterium]|nr:MAG: hypothetical protein C7N36_11090 [Bacteroidota bacterium]PTM12730.1 MAG: hypothetical protein DA408_09530 [Bacteroidota bacterium]